jgi:hypothetical protein
MRTTLEINDALLAKADSVAAKEQVFRLHPQVGRSDRGRPPLPAYDWDDFTLLKP